MRNALKRQFPQPADRPGDAPRSRRGRQNEFLGTVACPLDGFRLLGGLAAAADVQLRRFIDQQVGGIQKLKVPATDASIPVPPPPPPASGLTPDRYVTTEAKRFLGKLLFHDAVWAARINIKQGVPVGLPAGTAFGGTVNGSDPNVAAIVAATKQTGSCGSCHIGEAAARPVSRSTCTSAPRAAATPTRTATSSL